MKYLFPKNMRLPKMLVWSTFVTEIDTLYYGEQTDIYSDKIPYIYYKLKDYKNELVSKRLSLEETFDRQTRLDIYNKLSRAAGTQPIIQDNGMFFIYNITLYLLFVIIYMLQPR